MPLLLGASRGRRCTRHLEQKQGNPAPLGCPMLSARIRAHKASNESTTASTSFGEQAEQRNMESWGVTDGTRLGAALCHAWMGCAPLQPSSNNWGDWGGRPACSTSLVLPQIAAGTIPQHEETDSGQQPCLRLMEDKGSQMEAMHPPLCTGQLNHPTKPGLSLHIRTNQAHAVGAQQCLSPVLHVTSSHAPLGAALQIREHDWVEGSHFEAQLQKNNTFLSRRSCSEVSSKPSSSHCGLTQHHHWLAPPRAQN